MPAQTIRDYLASLPGDARREIAAVRDVVRRHLPAGYEEGVGYGMIAWFVPLTRLRDTYNGQPLMYAALAANKGYNTIHMMGVYASPAQLARFTAGFAKAGKKLRMGKACVRFQRADDLALEAIGESIASLPVDDYVALCERSRAAAKTGRAAARRAEARKSPATRSAAKKTAAKKTVAKKTAVKKTAVKKTAVKKTAVKKTVAKKTPTNTR